MAREMRGSASKEENIRLCGVGLLKLKNDSRCLLLGL